MMVDPTGPLSALSYAVALIPQTFEVIVPVIMLASARPRRERLGIRGALITAGAGAAIFIACPLVFLTVTGGSAPLDGFSYPLFSSTVILVSLVPLVMAIYEASAWQALFCVGAGYTIQNLASGTSEFVWLLIRQARGIPGSVTRQQAIATMDAPMAAVVTVVPLLLVYVISYFAFIRPARREGLGSIEDHGMAAVLLLVILVVITFDVLIKELSRTADFPMLFGLRAVHGTVCAFVLFVQSVMLRRRGLEIELAESQRIAAERERQYQLSRANIDAINVKCHDIRHQIHRAAAGSGVIDPEFLTSVEQEVAVYDSQAKTGNEALDTILTEKGLLCEREGISLSVIADGHALDALAPHEVYSFFGNALDNAIDAVRALDDSGQRSISLTVRRVGELATIHVENYFAGDRSFSGGLPQTSKDDTSRHGFGTRSMREIVERHGGTLTFGQRDRTFTVDAMIPVP